MPNRDLPDSPLSRFDSMETEALRRILRENGENPQQDSQMASTLYIIELLARRELEAGISPEPDCPVTRRKRPGMPGLLAAAAVVVLLLGIAINARGLWESIIRLYENSFSLFLPDSDHQDQPPLPLEGALGDFPEASTMLPTWFPEDYTPGESSVQQSPIARTYWAIFTGPRGDIRIRIGDYVEGSPTEYEYSDSLLEIYDVDGIRYYICRNYDTLVAVWLADRLECTITGDITLEEMKQMIASIGG